ncbi:MAG: hypothetical protein DHS20C16_08660 [Phycisphaerae bacterium]|nr:MAG: hypothetical protein DHS20C16_08660 [Phycisphaerae bacterium]
MKNVFTASILSCAAHILMVPIFGAAVASADEVPSANAIKPRALADESIKPVSLHHAALLEHKDEPTSPDLIGDPTHRGTSQPLARGATGPCRTVFGYLPYWESSANIQWDALTHLAAFSVEVNANGTLGNDHGWPWTALVNTAHANGVKVVLSATLFNTTDLLTLMTTPAYKQAFFVNIKNKMLEGTMDGVNMDFEGGGSWQAHAPGFMAELTAYMHAEVPGSEVTFAGPAVNWSNMNMPALAASCDGIFIMGYAFAGSWSNNSGPNSPLNGGSINITDTVLDEYGAVTQATPEKLILGIPYYGGHWTTTTSAARAPVIDWQGSTRFVNDEPNSQTYGRLWDATSSSPWYRWHDGTNWHQVWYDDDESLALKYDLAESNDLQGVGMWALNYDGSRPELWDAIRAYAVEPCCTQIVNENVVTVVDDDFDAGTSASGWNVFASSADYSADFAYDYSAVGIPPAPNTTGGSTMGLKFTVNNNDGIAQTAGVSAYPIGASVDGDHILKFDMWINYNGGSGGGSGSTEFMTAGLGQSGTQVNWSENPSSDGYMMAVTGEGGASQDYRVYDGATHLTVGAGVYLAGNQASTDSYYQTLFPSPTFETSGSPGKQWVEVEIVQSGDVMQWRMDGTIIASVVLGTPVSGTPMLGYMDPFSSIANPAAENYIIYDNVRVELLPDNDCNANDVSDGCETIANGDYNADGTVDALDYPWFADCFAGPTQMPAPTSLTCMNRCLESFDADLDGDVDLADYEAFSANIVP